MVRDDRADLGVVSARTFDTLGVTSFQALQAPYLVTSNELLDKVLADPVAGEMLDGTKELGLVGLGLAFDFLAYPGGFGGPLLSPEDYRGEAFQVRPSRANDLLTQALGATSDPRNGGALAANEPAFARANVIVANEKVCAGLSAAQQQALRDAASQTREWMAARHSDPAEMAAAYCSQGFGDIVVATPDDMAAMKAATAPVVQAMQRETTTHEVIARIRELAKSVTPPATPVACAAKQATVPVPEITLKGDQGAIDGVWRIEADKQVLLDGGVSAIDAPRRHRTWTRRPGTASRPTPVTARSSSSSSRPPSSTPATAPWGSTRTPSSTTVSSGPPRTQSSLSPPR